MAETNWLSGVTRILAEKGVLRKEIILTHMKNNKHLYKNINIALNQHFFITPVALFYGFSNLSLFNLL
jgi:hypothetical protein